MNASERNLMTRLLHSIATNQETITQLLNSMKLFYYLPMPCLLLDADDHPEISLNAIPPAVADGRAPKDGARPLWLAFVSRRVLTCQLIINQ
jgi:hypothetical protein